MRFEWLCNDKTPVFYSVDRISRLRENGGKKKRYRNETIFFFFNDFYTFFRFFFKISRKLLLYKTKTGVQTSSEGFRVQYKKIRFEKMKCCGISTKYRKGKRINVTYALNIIVGRKNRYDKCVHGVVKKSFRAFFSSRFPLRTRKRTNIFFFFSKPIIEMNSMEK